MGREQDAYIAENAGRMSTREMAAALGVGQATVVRRMKKLGLSGKKAGRKSKGPEGKKAPPPPAADRPPASGGDGYLDRMRELRDVLYGQLAEANAASIARVAREYREVCDIVRREEGSDERDDAGFSGLLGALGQPGADVPPGASL